MLIKSNIDVVTLITNKIEKTNPNSYLVIEGFYYIEFVFNSPAYPIVKYKGKFIKSESSGFLGHIININDKQFICGVDGIWRLGGECFEISTLTLAADEDVNIYYEIKFGEYLRTTETNVQEANPIIDVVATETRRSGKPTLLHGTWRPGDTIYTGLNTHYIDIEADEGCRLVIDINGVSYSFVIGDTERLVLDTKNETISQITFADYKNEPVESPHDFYINYFKEG